ncbi:hypothetical protein JL475_23650 [Streptomyces sp. M2CJ-2]|uniref:hypothetical protein n=1 Tax=Streptomyces sp. M2CJ-2 TaxID=2803948 RepID=UPI001928B42C|nr:hypothetical protein [Streptomyces sp. M2CJ-2]MBL3668933.1 hypothetical protein [Streptomyces sp. M2CJ-2]
MTAGWCFRTTRAAVFAAVCVLLAALGHVLMSGTGVPWWSLAAGTAVTGGAAWCLADRERGPVLVSSVVTAAQAALHPWFSYAQELAATSTTGGASDGTHSMLHVTHRGRGSSVAEPMGPLGAMDSMAGTGHTVGHTVDGMSLSSAGMLAAHLLAALLSGLWLAYGERAVFRILRAVAGWLAAPLRLPLAPAAPLRRPRVATRHRRTAHRPYRLFLVYAITPRGPPAGTAVV